jgi:molecular chaperone HtpG
MTTVDPSVETQPFQAEVSELLHLMVHSVYSETEIFLRELISNASDACDRLRYEAIANPTLIGDGDAPKIRIIPNKKNNTLTIADTGIGMDRQELIDNLGTIARSGTRSFVSRLKEAKDGASLIGQFGVGFYSAFMVAERIVVTSRRAGAQDAWTWSSSGGSGFEIAPAGTDSAPVPSRGTDIVLYLKADAVKYLPSRSSASFAPIPITSSSRSNSQPKRASHGRSIRRARCGSDRSPNSSQRIIRRPTSRLRVRSMSRP